MQDLKAYRLYPIAIEKPWGGTSLQQKKTSLKKENIKEDTLLGELVLASTLNIFPTSISPLGSNKSRILFSDYWSSYGSLKIQKIIQKNYYDEFPFILKILNTKDPLSVQVHPSTEQLKNLFGINATGKYETWVILNAHKNSNVYLGIHPDKKIKTFWNFITTQQTSTKEEILDFLQKVHPSPGDIFCIKPGTIHATIGEILFYEIQETSNYTYRIYDFGRTRKIHLDKAKKITHSEIIKKYHINFPPKNTPFSLQFEFLDQPFSKIIQSPFSIVTFFNEQSITCFFDTKAVAVEWGDSFLLWQETSIQYTPSKQFQHKKEYCIFSSLNFENAPI